jgi:hypothetical protein
MMQMCEPVLVRSGARPLDPRPQNDVRHRHPSRRNVARYALRMIGISRDREASQPRDVQKRQHMAAGQSGDQHLFRIDRGLHGPLADHMRRRGRRDRYAAVEAHFMRAAEAPFGEIVAVAQRPFHVRGIGRHSCLTASVGPLTI